MHTRTHTHTKVLIHDITCFTTVGYALVAINGHKLSNKVLPDGRRAMDVLQSEKDYPLSLRFSRMKVSVNERIMMLSTFHS